MINRKVLFFTSTRADYGILRSLMLKVNEHPDLQLLTLVSGGHLSSFSGSSLEEITKDKLPINERIEIDVLSNNGVGMAKSTGLAIIGFADAINRLSPDIIVLLGDRFEAMAMAQAAMYLGVPIAHIHGGEVTLGSVDDSIRHCITKMSDIHFVTCKEHWKRVVQLGESPSKVFDVGSLSVEKIGKQDLYSREHINSTFNVSDQDQICILSLHPATASPENILEAACNIIRTLDRYPNLKIFISFSNLDPGGALINKLWKDISIQSGNRIVLRESFGRKMHLSLMQSAVLMVGNSSSAIIEAASFALPVVNVGNRQKGRFSPSNVIHSDGSIKSIEIAVKKALNPLFNAKIKRLKNPYFKARTAENIINHLLSCESEKAHNFYDL